MDSLVGSRAVSYGGLMSLGGGARELEIVIVSIGLRQAAEVSTLMRTNVEGRKRLYFDTADENERLKLIRSHKFLFHRREGALSYKRRLLLQLL